jgi:serine protease Do
MSGSRQVSLGVVVRADGMILTKATELPEKFECRLPSGVVAEGSVLGTDLDFDLALVKIANDKLQPVTWLEAAAPTVGSWVATPSGFTSTPVAIGVVSVAERRIRTEPAVLGIQLEDTADGPRVIQVMENSGAEKAGIDVDDVILRINNQQVGTFANLRSLVRNHRPGEKLKVEVKRGEESLSKTVELTQQSEVMPDDEAIQNSIGGELSRRRTGFPGALQHDTVLAPNQCGGPLVNLEGQVIGINIARAGRVATYAASSRTIKPRVETLLKQADARQ